MDGLLSSNGRTTEAYWTYERYARLSGARVHTVSSDDRISGVAAADGGSVRALVGRDEACGNLASSVCSNDLAGTPTNVTVAIREPSGVSAVSVGRELLPDNGMTSPVNLGATTVTVTNDVATIPLWMIADGAAVSLTITPATPSPRPLLLS